MFFDYFFRHRILPFCRLTMLDPFPNNRRKYAKLMIDNHFLKHTFIVGYNHLNLLLYFHNLSKTNDNSCGQ